MDRALETARKIADEQSRFDVGCSPLPVAEIAALIQSAMNAQDKARLGTDWQELAEKNQETADKALALVDARNAQEREWREALRGLMDLIAAQTSSERCMWMITGPTYAEAERLLAERGEGK